MNYIAPKQSSGFTLVELLVTIAIIGLLAMVLVRGIGGAKKQAADATCRAHMRDLVQGAMNYYADKGTYPFAGSYEFYSQFYRSYSSRQGWVSWLRSDGSEVESYSDEKSHADKFRYVGTGAADVDSESDVINSIKYGSLFEYTRKNYANFCCGLYNDGHSRRAKRTYAMNKIFGARSNRREIGLMERDFASYDRSKLAVFVEVAALSGTAKASGEAGNVEIDSSTHPDGSSWEYDKEDLGAWHVISGKKATTVAFADGHVETLTVTPSTMRQLCEDLGKGKFKGVGEY